MTACGGRHRGGGGGGKHLRLHQHLSPVDGKVPSGQGFHAYGLKGSRGENGASEDEERWVLFAARPLPMRAAGSRTAAAALTCRMLKGSERRQQYFEDAGKRDERAEAVTVRQFCAVADGRSATSAAMVV